MGVGATFEIGFELVLVDPVFHKRNYLISPLFAHDDIVLDLFQLMGKQFLLIDLVFFVFLAANTTHF